MTAWLPGELLLRIHHERTWREGGYEPFTLCCTTAHVLLAEKNITTDHPHMNFSHREHAAHYNSLVLIELAKTEALLQRNRA